MHTDIINIKFCLKYKKGLYKYIHVSEDSQPLILTVPSVHRKRPSKKQN